MTWLSGRRVRAAITITGLVVAGVGSAALTVALLASIGPAAVGPADALSGFAGTLVLAAALSLIAAAVVAWTGRPSGTLAVVVAWAAASWVAFDLVANDVVVREARTLGILLAPMAVPLLAHLPLRALRLDSGRLARVALAGLYLLTAVAALGHAFTWDRYLILACEPVCRQHDNLLALAPNIPQSATFERAWLVVAVATGLALAAWSGARVLRALRATRPPGVRQQDVVVLLPAGGVGIALAAWAAAVRSNDALVPIESVQPDLRGLLALAVLGLGLGVAWWLVLEARRLRRVRDLVALMDAGIGSRSLRDALATVLQDPTVGVAYPTVGGRATIDDQGSTVPRPSSTPGRTVTPIERGGVTVALVEHDSALDPGLLTRQIGAAARLAVDNERLAALLRAQVRELQASRERIVAAGDAARGRLERDLHDGAQQRLLAASYELRLAQATAGDERSERRVAIDAAVDEIDHTLVELRELAHGIWPAVLAEAGLEAALGSLADEAPIPVTLDAIPEQRFPARTEAAAYLAVTEALRRATTGGAASLVVSTRQVDDRLELEARAPGLVAPGPWLRVDDRVGAAGGRSAVTSDPATGTLLRVELPCA